MKILYKILFINIISIFLFSFIAGAQKDTTELNVGNKKLIITDKRTQKENAIYNLEKAKESFEKEIAQTEEFIKLHKELLKQQEELVKKRKELLAQHEDLLKKREELIKEKNIKASGNDAEIAVTEEDNENINKSAEEKMKILLYEKELKALETEIEKEKLLIELNKKKQTAFEQGIADIDKGIADIKKGLNSLNNDLNDKKEKQFRKELYAGNRIHNGFNAHWAGFEFGLLNFLNAKRTLASDEELDFLILIPEKTMSYGLNIFEYDVALSRNKRFGAATGAGLEWNSLALKRNVNLYEDENGIIRAEYVDPALTEYTKNKLNVVYVTVPLILEFQIPVKHRKFFIGAGITGGIRAWSKQKQKYKIDGQVYKNKKSDDFQLASFRYGATARIGYGDVGFFINYSFVPLFNEGAGPELFPISVGLKIVDF